MRSFLPQGFRNCCPWRLALTALAFAVVTPMAQPAHAAQPRLFLGSDRETDPSLTAKLPRPRAVSRRLEVNPELVSRAAEWLRPGTEVRLDLLSGQDVTLAITEVRAASDGALEIHGHPTTDPDGSVDLVWDAGNLSGTAEISGLGRYQWTPQSGGVCEVARIAWGWSHICVAPPGWESERETSGVELNSVGRHEPVNGRWDPSTEPLVVDILLLYSNTVLAAEGDEFRLQQRILRTVEFANYCFTNSLIGVRLNPVYLGPIDWAESGSIQTDLSLIPSDSRVATLRNNYKADLVYLFVEAENIGWGGVAPIAPAGGNPDEGYSVQTRSMLTGRPRDIAFSENVVFAHETGHLLGSQHDRRNSFDVTGTPYPGAFNFSHGFRFRAKEQTYTSIMAYEPGIPLPFFSNPELEFEGARLGIPETEPEPTDNAQSINRVAPFVARYRTAVSRVSFDQKAARFSESAGTVTLGLTRTGDLNSATRVQVSFDLTAKAKNGSDYLRPASTLVDFGTNQATAQFSFTILQDDLLEGDETLQINLSPVSVNHGLGEHGSILVTLRDDEPALVALSPTLILREGEAETDVSFEYTGVLADGESRVVELKLGGEGATAIQDLDYQISSTQLTFTSTTRVQTVRVRPLLDSLVESDETFQIIAGNASTTVRILDVDRSSRNLSMTGADDSVGALVALPGGGVMVAGDFSKLDGVSRPGLARIDSRGQLDPTYSPAILKSSPVQLRGIPPARVNVLRQDRQGRWLVGGFIGQAGDQSAGNLIRLLPDGKPDPNFQNPKFNGAVRSLLEQSDGRLVVGGAFEEAGGQPVRGIVRLNADGTVDDTFQNRPAFEGWGAIVNSLAELPNGQLLVGGGLEKHSGQTIRNLARLNANGAIDRSFPLLRSGTSGGVTTIAALPDGRSYLGGFFELAGGRSYRRLARLSSTGAIDPTFKNVNANAEINCLLPLPNGQLLVGGAFSKIGNLPRRCIALLNEDGTVDTSYDVGTGTDGHVWALAAGGDGSLYVGGAFTTFNDQPAPRLARLGLPQISGSFLGAALGVDGTFSTRVMGLPGARYAVESSSDLKDWKPAGEVRIERPDHSPGFESRAGGETQFFRLAPIR